MATVASAVACGNVRRQASRRIVRIVARRVSRGTVASQASALSKLLGNKGASSESGPQLAIANEGEEGFKVTLWMLGTKTKIALKMLRNATVDEVRA